MRWLESAQIREARKCPPRVLSRSVGHNCALRVAVWRQPSTTVPDSWLCEGNRAQQRPVCGCMKATEHNSAQCVVVRNMTAPNSAQPAAADVSLGTEVPDARPCLIGRTQMCFVMPSKPGQARSFTARNLERHFSCTFVPAHRRRSRRGIQLPRRNDARTRRSRRDLREGCTERQKWADGVASEGLPLR